MTYKS